VPGSQRQEAARGLDSEVIGALPDIRRLRGLGLHSDGMLVYNPPVPDILKLRNQCTHRREACLRVAVSAANRDEMIDEKELIKLLMARIEIEMPIPYYQMGVASLIVRRIAPKVLEIIKEEVRTARREQAVKVQKHSG
jgi:hypothetical protein